MKKTIRKAVATVLSLSMLGLVGCGGTTGANTDEVGADESGVEVETQETVPPRDGTPKKYFTLSFDDGITQDLRIIEILKKYNVDSCTFMINTGLYGADWAWVGQQYNRPDVTHKRFTEEELRSGIYDGFDVQVHTLTHPSLKAYDAEPEKIKEEIEGDAANIESITGRAPTGMAWPGGDYETTEFTIKHVLENTNIRFARGILSTHSFELPEYFMRWEPTCSIAEEGVLKLAKKFVNSECKEDMLFYVWGHGYELDLNNSYDTFEELVKMMSEAEDVILVTNAEFYELFKDEIPSWK